MTSPSCTTAGRLRVVRGLSWTGSESVISAHPFRIGIGNAELGEDFPLELFHRPGLFVFFVVVTDQMQETVNRKMAEMMVERLLFLAAVPSRRLVGNGDVAQHARRIRVPARAGRLQRGKR